MLLLMQVSRASFFGYAVRNQYVFDMTDHATHGGSRKPLQNLTQLQRLG